MMTGGSAYLVSAYEMSPNPAMKGRSLKQPLDNEMETLKHSGRVAFEKQALDLEPQMSKKRKRGQLPTSEDAEEEAPREKRVSQNRGCTVNGCRNPIAGCPELTRLGVCWLHGENHTRLQVDGVVSSSPPRRKLRRTGRATNNEPEVVVSKQKEVRSLSSCSHEGCTNLAQRGGICRKHGGKQIRKTCSNEGCAAIAHKGGVCIRHGAKAKTCCRDGCTNNAKIGGVCCRHGAKVKRYHKICSHNGCTNKS